MEQVIENYTFSHSAKTITCSDFSSGQPLRLERIKVIADATTSKCLWSSVDNTLSTATVTSNNIITLSALQGGEADTDNLTIVYESAPGDPQYSGTFPTSDAAAEASLAIVAIPNIDKHLCDAVTLTLNTAYVWNITSTLNGSLASSGALTILTNAVVGPAGGGSFLIKIDSEQMFVTAGGGTNSLTVTSGNRAQNGTSAAAHSNGATLTTLFGFTANEIEITSTNGIAVVYYTLDGTTPTATNFTGILVATPCSTILPCNGAGPALGGGTSLQMIAAGTPLITAAIRGA